MMDYIIEGIKTFFSWLLSWVSSFGPTILQWIQDLIPAHEGQQSAWNTCKFALDAANQWAPIDLGLTLAASFMGFILSFLLVKIIVKMIP